MLERDVCGAHVQFVEDDPGGRECAVSAEWEFLAVSVFSSGERGA
jgi:hypothetical protein